MLLDASPDVRHQLHHLGPRPARQPVDAVILTHGHMGHYTGLVHFGKEALASSGLPVYGTPSMMRFLSDNDPWAQLAAVGHLDLRSIEPGVEFDLWPGTTLRLLEVPHRADFTDTVAISVAGRLLYLPDIDSWAAWPAAAATIAGHQVALIDGTFHREGEVAGRPHADIAHPPVADTMQRFEHLTATTRIILTHLNHTNPLCDPASAETAQVTAAGFEVAYDGMRI